MKKGRHRRFEEARKLKQQGPGFFLGEEPRTHQEGEESEDEFDDIAKRYGAFDDDDDEDQDDG